MYAFFFYLNKIAQTEKNLIRPFCDDKHFTAVAHFTFECNIKSQFDGTLHCFFFNFQTRIVMLSSNT